MSVGFRLGRRFSGMTPFHPPPRPRARPERGYRRLTFARMLDNKTSTYVFLQGSWGPGKPRRVPIGTRLLDLYQHRPFLSVVLGPSIHPPRICVQYFSTTQTKKIRISVILRSLRSSSSGATSNLPSETVMQIQ